ncbi:hypothetical protein SCB49_14230 [unidentified eubacterium SCB49]|nr:hypothetical protein SCB49_14230 [unidentified eubacterium SCB49]
MLKKIIMKKNISKHSILLFLSALLFISCQLEDTIIENPPLDDSIIAGSDLANLIQRAAIEDRSYDDFIDFANCLSINLPFTVQIGETTITITTESDYEEVLDVLDNQNNEYEVEIIYPIVITLSDFTQIVINSEKELAPYKEACQEESQGIPCINFIYPLSFSIYNIEFELIDTVTINTNEELYFFIGNIQEETLVSLNFPVELELQTGEVIEVNTNTELQEAIENAMLNCDSMGQVNFSCFDAIDDNLTSCVDTFNTTAYFNLTETIANCETQDIFNVSYHYTENDALANENPISNTIEFGLESPFTNNNIYILVTSIAYPDESRIYPITLIVNNCNDEVCAESTLYENLSQCTWLTGGDTPFTLSFNDNEATATLNEQTQIANFATSTQTIENSGQVFTFFTLEGFDGAFSILNNTYEIGYCSETVITIHDTTPNPLYFSELTKVCDTECDNPGILTEGLIIYIPFGEEAVELITDEILIDEAITYTEDRAGNPNCAAAFTANGAVIPITVTQENALVTTDEFSISIWFQMTNDATGDLETFFQKGESNDQGFLIGVHDGNTPLCLAENPPFSIWDTDWSEEVDVTWFNTDWHHLVITKTQDNIVELWRDGELRNTMEGLDIGAENLNYYLGNNLVGNLDDIRVYNRKINTDEILTLYELEADCFTCL